MSWERDFEGIPLQGKHTVYSFLFRINETNHTYETICDKELTAKRRYGRHLKKIGDTKFAEIISFCSAKNKAVNITALTKNHLVKVVIIY